MNDFSKFENLKFFFDNNPRTKFNDIMEIAKAMVYYDRLGGKDLDDIVKAMRADYRQVTKIASELEITNYKTYKLPVLRQMVIDRYKSIFAKAESTECKNATTEQTFIQATLTIGRPVEIFLSDEHDFDNVLSDTIIEFNEDKNGHRTIPKLSSVEDLFETVVPIIYHNEYRSLKLYKGVYYKYMNKKWHRIVSLTPVSKLLFDVICKNFMTLSLDSAAFSQSKIVFLKLGEIKY